MLASTTTAASITITATVLPVKQVMSLIGVQTEIKENVCESIQHNALYIRDNKCLFHLK